MPFSEQEQQLAEEYGDALLGDLVSVMTELGEDSPPLRLKPIRSNWNEVVDPFVLKVGAKALFKEAKIKAWEIADQWILEKLGAHWFSSTEPRFFRDGQKWVVSIASKGNTVGEIEIAASTGIISYHTTIHELMTKAAELRRGG